MSLTGTGTGTAPVASVSPTSAAFANQQVNTTSAAQNVTLSNTGGSTLTISSITVTGANPGDFAQTNTCGTSVAAGANCTISVTFTPTVAAARTATLSVSDNAAGSPQTVALTGTGTAIPTWSISGTITPLPAGSGVLVSLGGAPGTTTTTDSSGNYSFAGLANGSYTVTPSKTGFTFSPPNQTVTITNGNVAAVNFIANTAPPSTISIDATAWGNVAAANSTISTSAFSTTAANELLLAFVATDAQSGANTTVTNVTGAGLTWALVVRTNVQRGTSEIWRAFAPSPLSNVTVTATLSSSVPSSLTAMSFKGVDTSGANGSGAIGAIRSANASSGAPTATLVTTRNNSWVFGVGNDFDKAIARTLGAGQTLIHQYMPPVGDTYWVQMQSSSTPASGTSVTINDTAPTGDRYNLSICEVVPAP